jgi:hypothetical protein
LKPDIFYGYVIATDCQQFIFILAIQNRLTFAHETDGFPDRDIAFHVKPILQQDRIPILCKGYCFRQGIDSLTLACYDYTSKSVGTYTDT